MNAVHQARLIACTVALFAAAGCSNKPEFERLARERDVERTALDKQIQGVLHQVADARAQLGTQAAAIEKLRGELKSANDKVVAQEHELAALRARRLPTEEEMVIAKLDFSTLKVCAMQGVACMAKTGERLKAEALTAFLGKALKNDEDIARLKMALAADRAAATEPGETKP